MRSIEATVKEKAISALWPMITNGAPPYVTPTMFSPSALCRPARYQRPGTWSMERCGSAACSAAFDAERDGATTHEFEAVVMRMSGTVVGTVGGDHGCPARESACAGRPIFSISR